MSELGRTRTAQLTLAAAVVSALAMGVLFNPGQDPSRVYFGTDTHASGLLIGALLAFVWPLGPLRGTPNTHAAIVLDIGALAGLVLVVAAITGWEDYDPWVYRGGTSCSRIACALLIAAVVAPRRPHPARARARAVRVDRAAQLRDLPLALADHGPDPSRARPATGAAGCSSRCRSASRSGSPRCPTSTSRCRSAPARAASRSPPGCAAGRRAVGSRSSRRRSSRSLCPWPGSGASTRRRRTRR